MPWGHTAAYGLSADGRTVRMAASTWGRASTSTPASTRIKVVGARNYVVQGDVEFDAKKEKKIDRRVSAGVVTSVKNTFG